MKRFIHDWADPIVGGLALAALFYVLTLISAVVK
jgi:hypothetical protein